MDDMSGMKVRPLNRKVVIVIIAVVCFVFMGAYFFFAGNFNARTDEVAGKKSFERISDDLGFVYQAESLGINNWERDPFLKEKMSAESLGSLQRELAKIFGDKEALRSKLLLESKRGSNYCYLLGVDPPTSEEVEAMRIVVSHIQKRVSKEDSEKLDKYVGELIKRYDPFGLEGKKAIYIVIPEDFEREKISGVTFTVDNFEEVKERFNPSVEKTDFPYENVRPYIRSDMKELLRFGSLIKHE